MSQIMTKKSQEKDVSDCKDSSPLCSSNRLVDLSVILIFRKKSELQSPTSRAKGESGDESPHSKLASLI